MQQRCTSIGISMYFLHWPFLPGHRTNLSHSDYDSELSSLIFKQFLGSGVMGEPAFNTKAAKCHCLLSFFVLIRLADWRILVPITCLRESCNLFWASQRKSMQTLFPVSALLWLIALHLLVLSGNTDKFRHWKKQLWSCLRKFHSSMLSPFFLHPQIAFWDQNVLPLELRQLHANVSSLLQHCVCFVSVFCALIDLIVFVPFLFLSAPQSAQRTSVVKSGKLAIQRSFRLRSFLSLRLGPFHDPCPCLDSREHSDDHHLDSAKQKHYLFLQKTKLYRAAHHPFISVGLKLLDGLEWTMDVEIGTKQQTKRWHTWCTKATW